MHQLQTPKLHDMQFIGQQYPEVKIYEELHTAQLVVEAQDVHPAEQGGQVLLERKYPPLHVLHIPAVHEKQFKGQQYPEVNTYDELQPVQLVTDEQVVHPVEQAVHNPDDK